MGDATSSVIRRAVTRRMPPSSQGEGFGRAVRERPLGCKTRRLESRRVGRVAFPNDLPLTCRSAQALSGSGRVSDHTTPWASMASVSRD